MSYRKLLALVPGGHNSEAVMRAGFQLVGQFNAHLVGLTVRADALEAFIRVGGAWQAPQSLVDNYIETFERKELQRVDQARTIFESLAREASISLLDDCSAPKFPSACWMEDVGDAGKRLAFHSVLSDLTIVSRPDVASETGGEELLSQAMMSSGHPLLIIPDKGPRTLGERVLVAWNGSAEASRSLALAIPFLERARLVTIVRVGEMTRETSSPEQVRDYLRWHGIEATCRNVDERVGSTGEALQMAAQVTGSDLVVMGAYTRSRLRELIFGGVTRHMLRHSEIPTLMTH